MADELIPDEHYDGLISAFEWMFLQEVALVNLTPPEQQKCDPGCPGWAVFSEGRGMDQAIQSCDQCNRHGDDHGALTYVLTRLGNAMERRHRHEIDKQEEQDRKDYGPEPR